MKTINKILTFITITALSAIYLCTPVFAATEKDYEAIGESAGPFLIIGLIGLGYWFFRKKE